MCIHKYCICIFQSRFGTHRSVMCVQRYLHRYCIHASAHRGRNSTLWNLRGYDRMLVLHMHRG